MRTLVVGGIVLVAVCFGAIQAASSRAEQQRRARADVAAKAIPTSTTDRIIVDQNVVAYTTKNEAILAARKQARETLPRFVALRSSGMKATYTVKFPLTQNGKTEHIWLQVDDVEKNGFRGRLANEPVNGTAYRKGQTMTVANSDVEDWMVRTPDAIYGGYSTRYQLKDMPNAQAERLAALFRD
jgi:uncharacterized protein YegJ (DUF2314 family)